MKIWADEMIMQYKKHRSELVKKRNKLNKKDPQDKLDLKQYNSMIDEMDFVLHWLETGRDPNNYRGVDKKGIYQYQSFCSLDFIPDITEQLEEGPKQLRMTAEEKVILADIFASLSFRERQCFILHNASGLSMGRIAEEIGLKKRTVQQYIDRAKLKIKKKIK